MSAEGDNQAPVVIVGTGPTGLALAIELGTRNVPCIVLEREERRGYAPRAKMTNVRTREIMRRWGIADALAQASPFGVDYPSDIHFVTRLDGHVLARFERIANSDPTPDGRYSEHAQWIPQYKLEAVLMAKARQLASVEFRFATEFVDLAQDEDGINVQVRHHPSGALETIRASFLVGADGPRSSVREVIGSRMVGTYGLSRNYNVIFRAPGLAAAHPHGPGIMYWLINPEAPSVIGPMDDRDLWFFGPMGLPADKTLDDDEMRDLISRSTGIDLPYEILSSDVWIASRLLADRYRRGRVFLAGDACHLHPPFGGYGMNMGVADALDLGWKLAAVVEGWGGAALLDSYEAERRPVHQIVMDEAENNHKVAPNQLLRRGIEDPGEEGAAIRTEVSELIRETKRQEFYTLGIVLGLRYVASPIIVPDGTEQGWRPDRDYVPSAAPGCLAPHAWLGDGRSLYDLFGPGFTLLAFDGVEEASLSRAIAEAAALEMPLTVVRMSDDELAASYACRLALIRPDQHVAWRGDAWPDDDLLRFVSGFAAKNSTSPAQDLDRPGSPASEAKSAS